MKRLLLSLLGTLCCAALHAQVRDTLPTPEPAPVSLFKTLEPRLWVLPAAAIVYGVASLHNGELDEFNQHVHWELSQEHPHKDLHLDNYLQYSPAVAVYALNAFGVKGKHDFLDRSIIYGISTAIMATTVIATKHITHEERPDHSDYLSFPSGHTPTAFAAAEFMRREYEDVSIWYGVAGYAAAAATGYLRMYNNKHWFSDVVAGAGVGILSTDLAYLMYPSVKRLLSPRRSVATTMVLPFYQQGAVGLSLVHRL